ncbi:MAG: hypothetical protein IJW04_00250 [Ruminococcus sp.]|nr:hypothetical protein [Ruminococcus sp.]
MKAELFKCRQPQRAIPLLDRLAKQLILLTEGQNSTPSLLKTTGFDVFMIDLVA